MLLCFYIQCAFFDFHRVPVFENGHAVNHLDLCADGGHFKKGEAAM